MRFVSPDHGHIDYTYDHAADERLGIRVRPGRANIIRSDGNDLHRMVIVYGTHALIPLDALPAAGMAIFSSVAFAREEYMAMYPQSDLAEVLTGSKTFIDALQDAGEH
jgi:hypothetical protein